MLVFKVEAECKNIISSNYCPDCLNSRQIFDFELQFPFDSGFLDQQAIVWCNSVI